MYTHKITYYKKTSYGWVFDEFKTTSDAVAMHAQKLSDRQQKGEVLNVDIIKL